MRDASRGGLHTSLSDARRVLPRPTANHGRDRIVSALSLEEELSPGVGGPPPQPSLAIYFFRPPPLPNFFPRIIPRRRPYLRTASRQTSPMLEPLFRHLQLIKCTSPKLGARYPKTPPSCPIFPATSIVCYPGKNPFIPHIFRALLPSPSLNLQNGKDNRRARSPMSDN